MAVYKSGTRKQRNLEKTDHANRDGSIIPKLSRYIGDTRYRLSISYRIGVFNIVSVRHEVWLIFG